MILTIPYPPSINKYWLRTSSGGLMVSSQGRDFRVQVQVAALCACVKKLTGQLDVKITLTPNDRRVRDIDNPIKPLLDALTKAGAWDDDSQVRRLVVEMLPPDPGNGRTVVKARELRPTEG